MNLEDAQVSSGAPVGKFKALSWGDTDVSQNPDTLSAPSIVKLDIEGAFAATEVAEVILATGFDADPVPVERTPIPVPRNVPFRPVVLRIGQVATDEGSCPGAQVYDRPYGRLDARIPRVPAEIDFRLVFKSVSVGVCIIGVGSDVVHFVTVLQSVAIAVRIPGIRSRVGRRDEFTGVGFGTIIKSVIIGVGIVRVRLLRAPRAGRRQLAVLVEIFESIVLTVVIGVDVGAVGVIGGMMSGILTAASIKRSLMKKLF